MCPGDSPWHDPDPVSSFACGFEKRHVAQPQTLRLAAGCEIHTQAQYRHCNAPGFQNTILFLLSEYYIEYIVEFREEFIFGGSLNKTRIHPYVCFCVAHAVTILLSICCGLCLTAFSLVCNTLWMNMLVSVCMAQDGHSLPLQSNSCSIAICQIWDQHKWYKTNKTVKYCTVGFWAFPPQWVGWIILRKAPTSWTS